MIFDYGEQNRYFKILIRYLWEKMSMGRGLGALQFFWSLRKGTRTFYFRYNEPSCDILGPLGRYDDPWGKENKTTNKHAPVICLLAKKYEIPYFGR